MRAQGARHEGQGVALQDDAQGVGVAALVVGAQVAGDVLVNGAVLAAGRGEAVHQRQLARHVTLRHRLNGVLQALLARDGRHQRVHGSGVHTGKALGVNALQRFSHLGHAVVAAGLQDVGGHGHGPDARIHQAANVLRVRAAGVGDAQLALELVGNAVRQGQAQRVQGSAGHVHLLAGQLRPGHVHGEGVGELHAKLQAALVAELLQTVQHGNGVGPLQVLHEVVLVEDDVVKAQAVQHVAGGAVTQERGVALDEGVEPLLANEVGGDALDLVGRAAVKGGLGDGVGDAGRDGVNKGLVNVVKEAQVGARPGNGLLELRLLGGVHHLVDEAVHLGGLYALQVIAHGHVEDEAVRVSQAQLARQQLAGNPGLHVLRVGLRHGQLRGPLAVVALVGGQDAGLVDAGGKLRAVHLLHGLELKEAGARHVGGDDVLR